MRSAMKAMLVVAATIAATAVANAATTYSFDVNYDISGITTFGADGNPVGVALNSGESFTYNLTGTGGSWQVSVDGYYFLPSLLTFPDSARSNTGSVTFLNNGGIVHAASLGPTCCVHVGVGDVYLTAGFTFDQMTLVDTVTSSNGLPSTFQSAYPIYGAPHQYPGITFIADAVAGVPEPATWAMIMIGFAAVGFGLGLRRAEA